MKEAIKMGLTAAQLGISVPESPKYSETTLSLAPLFPFPISEVAQVERFAIRLLEMETTVAPGVVAVTAEMVHKYTKHFLELKAVAPDSFHEYANWCYIEWNKSAMKANLERLNTTMDVLNRLTGGKPKHGVTVEHRGINRAMRRNKK